MEYQLYISQFAVKKFDAPPEKSIRVSEKKKKKTPEN